MKSKAAIIVIVCLVLAAAVVITVVLSTSRSSSHTPVESAVETVFKTDAPNMDEVTVTAVTQTDDTSDPIVVSDSDTVLPDVTLSIRKVVQKDSAEEVSPRLVFGEAYKECYLKLFGDTVELCLNPYTEKVDTGTYTYEDVVMRVGLGYDRSAEYRVILSDDGQLQYIVVGHDGYDCYFG